MFDVLPQTRRCLPVWGWVFSRKFSFPKNLWVRVGQEIPHLLAEQGPEVQLVSSGDRSLELLRALKVQPLQWVALHLVKESCGPVSSCAVVADGVVLFEIQIVG